MKLLELHERAGEGKTIWINPKYIVQLSIVEDDTLILMSLGNHVRVRERIGEILSQLES